MHVAKASSAPTSRPTLQPSRTPTLRPSKASTRTPTLTPTKALPQITTLAPSDPSLLASMRPSLTPSLLPSRHPTLEPTRAPTLTPTLVPTDGPSWSPSYAPAETESLGLRITRTPTIVYPPCYPVYAPLFGGLGDCAATLQSGRSCTFSCSSGYTLSGRTRCHRGKLTAGVCVASSCDASVAPRNGAAGSCGATLESDQSCEPVCDDGYTASGPSRCLAGVLTAATCRPSTPTCENPSAPPGCFSNGIACEACCAPFLLSAADLMSLVSSGANCWDAARGITPMACCSTCLTMAPENGLVGLECPAILASNSECKPVCNDGYQLSASSGTTRCVNGVIQLAKCERVDTCGQASFAVSSVSMNGTFTATLQTTSSVPRTPTVTVVPAAPGSTEIALVVNGAHLIASGSLRVGAGFAAQVSVNGVTCTSRDIGAAVCRRGYHRDGLACVRDPNRSVCTSSPLRWPKPSQKVGMAGFFVGSSVTISATANTDGCQTSLVAVGSVAPRGIRQKLTLLDSNIGEHIVALICPGHRSCSMATSGRIIVRCKPTQVRHAGRCADRQSVCATEQILDNGVCKRPPHVRVPAAHSIYIDVTKNKGSVFQQLIVHAELSGSSEVAWSSSCGMMPWVAGNSSGTLRPKAPVATFSVLLNATGRLDYSNAAETPTASLMLQTSYMGGPPDAPPIRVEHARSLRIHMKVLSEAYVLREDVTIMAIESGLWLRLETFALPEDGSRLPLLWGRSLRFQVAHLFPRAACFALPSKLDDTKLVRNLHRYRSEISTGFLFAANRTCISRSLGLKGRFDWHKWLKLASSFLVLLRVTTSASALRSHTKCPCSTTESSSLSSTSLSVSLLQHGSRSLVRLAGASSF